MFKTKEWIQACIAGIVFVMTYNILYLHMSITDSLIRTLIISIEANLIVLIIIKLKEFLGA